MKVKILKPVAGDNGVLIVGQIYDCEKIFNEERYVHISNKHCDNDVSIVKTTRFGSPEGIIVSDEIHEVWS